MSDTDINDERKPLAKPPGSRSRRNKSADAKPPAKKAARKRSAARRGKAADPHAEREARRYERPIPSREAILAFLKEYGELAKAEVIADRLGLVEEQDLLALDKRLAAMLRDGQVHQNRRGGFGVASKLNLIPGVVLANADGYGFLRPDEGGDDLYLSPAQMRAVLHGDRVLASVVEVRRGRTQGNIVEVLERRTSRLVGRVVRENGLILVTPDDRRVHQDILITPGEESGAKAGQIVIVEITSPPTNSRGPLGRIISVLGDKLTPSLVVEMAIASHDIPHEWPAETTAAAANIGQQVSKADMAGRTDLRELPLITIDGADARDFDDAVYAKRNWRGGYRLVVAIADVSHYVRPGDAIDDEAVNRATSTYFPGYVVPMLPETLSNGICSLNPGVDRLCMVCDMRVNKNGEVTSAKFERAVMRSHARLTYDTVWKAVGEDDAEARAQAGDVLEQLETLHELYQALAKARRKRGAIDFDTVEVEFALDTEGVVVQMASRPRNDAHRLIEECMIAANVQAAAFLERRKIPSPYRVHAPPPAGKYEDLLEFLREFKLTLPPAERVTPADFAELLERTRDRPEADLISSVLLRAQSMAVYQPENHGHFGLALQAYTHFTSPIRRYPDLLVHRAITHALAGGNAEDYQYSESEMAALCVQASEKERRAEEAERDVDDRYRTAWIEKHVGSEFDGVVTGVTSFGLFVELLDSRVTGLVHVTQLPNDYYQFDPIRRLLSGERRGLRFRLGDNVRVQVMRANMEERKIDFRLARDSAKS